MPIEWNATAAWIALAIAIITPAVTTLLTNWHHRKMKDKELNHEKQFRYYEEQKLCFKGYLESASAYMLSANVGKRTDFDKHFRELFLYLPEKDWANVKKLHEAIVLEGEYSSRQIAALTELLAKRLQESSQKFPV